MARQNWRWARFSVPGNDVSGDATKCVKSPFKAVLLVGQIAPPRQTKKNSTGKPSPTRFGVTPGTPPGFQVIYCLAWPG